MVQHNLTKLEQLLGYTFSNATYLKVALTHKSFGTPNYERLEFVGDSILNYVIALNLYQLYPHHAEGTLSKMRALLVNEATLAEIAHTLNLGQYICLGVGEDKSGGRIKSSILADSLEAIFAAISLDSSITSAQQIITQLYHDKLTNIKPLTAKDSKSQLQEYTQAKQFAIPSYTVIHMEGPEHSKQFHVQCSLNELNLHVTGNGKTKKEASQQAASKLLDLIRQK